MFLLSKTNLIIFILLFSAGILSPLFAQQVQPDGSFSYTYPIKLPPGIAGIEPALSLAYNSNRGNSFCGVGWSLAGLSAITRDSSYPINFAAADHYLFAGQRLIYSPTDGYFHTEKEGSLRIAAYTAAGIKTGPAADIAYWIVTQKSGTKMYFGYNSEDHTTETDGHIDAVGKSGKALLWALSKVEDVHGNYYYIEYFEDINGAYYPLKIIYTKNASNPLLKFRTVEFYYETREEPDHCILYVPSRVDISKRLRWIVVKTDDQLDIIARKYRIRYSEGSSTGRSRIVMIEEYGAGGSSPHYGILPNIHPFYITNSSDSSLPPIEFTYTDGDNSFTGSIWSQAGDWTNIKVGDFNGDGKSDFMQYLGDGDGWRVMLSTGISFTGRIWSQAGDWTNIMVGDFNGDGKSDFMQYLGDGDGWRVMLSTGSSFTGSIWTKAGDWTNIMVGDFNGDGKSDFIQYLGDGDGWRVMLSTGSSFTGSIWSQAGDWINNMVGDFNGDGKSDLMQYVNNQGWRVYISTGSSFSHSIWSNNELSIFDLFHNLVGDFNGDGKSDFIQHVRDQGWRVYISTGSSFTASFWLEEGTGSNWKNNMVGDFNGDGKSDLIQYVEGQGWRVLISTGSKFYSTGIIAVDLKNFNMIGDFDGNGKSDFLQYLGDGTGWKVLHTQDMSYDKIKTIKSPSGATTSITYKPAPQVSGVVDSSKTAYPYIVNSSPRQLVTSVTINDGMGKESSTSYEYSNGMYYTGYRDKRRNIGFEWIKTKNDSTGSYIKTEFYHKSDNPLFQGLIKRRTMYDTNSNKYIENFYLYDFRREIIAANNFHEVNFVFKKDDYTYHYDGTTIKETYRTQYAFYDDDGNVENYDDYGNLLQRKNYGNVAVPGDESTVIVEYSIDEENYIMVPCLKTTYAADIEGVWGTAGTVKYYYDHQPYEIINDKGLCTKKEVQAEDGKWITTRYEYDANGRLESILDPLAIAGGYTTQEFGYTLYDNNRGEYYDSITNALGMTGYVYYDEFLRPVEQVDADGISRYTAYDEFGRPVKTWGPGSSETNPDMVISYHEPIFSFWGWQRSISKPQYIHIMKKDHTPDGFNTYVYADGFGRTIQTKTEGNDEKWTTTDSYYDENGQNYKNSVPYDTTTSGYTKRDETQICVENEYDPIGRIKETTHTDGNKSKAFYDHRKYMLVDASNHVSVTETIGNKIIETVYEGEFPNLNSIDELPGSFYSQATTETGYDGTRIIDHAGNVITTRNDKMNRKVSYSDPDLGEWTYEYDDSSRLTSQTDAKGQIINLDYDKLGRLIRKKYGAQINSEYFYDGLDETGNPDGWVHGTCIGRLTSVVFPCGFESYEYDNKGRIIQITKKIDEWVRKISMTYDEMDRLKTETLPDGEVITYAYGQDENLVSVNGEDTYASDIAFTAYGKLEKICYGNGITTTYKYYDDATTDPSNDNKTHSYRLQEIQVKNSDGLSIAHTAYEYDASDNLVRKEFTDGFYTYYTEEYTYDHFNRLVTAVSPELYGETSYSYDSLNNILTKDGRTYNYNTEVDGRTLPHAVSTIEDTAGNPLYKYDYDQNGNMIAARGQSKITIRARGTGVTDDPPVMELWFAGEKQMRWTVTNEEYEEFVWHGYWDITSRIDIVFVNDNSSGGIGTDLFIDWVEVNGVKKQAEDNTVLYDRGYYWGGCFDGADVIPGQEQMNVTGALRFTFLGLLALDRTMSYDYENRMTRLSENGTTAAFAYNPRGERIKKTVNGVTTYYFFGNYEEVVAESETTVIKYYFGPNGRIAQRRKTGTEDELLFISTDHLGSAVRMTDRDGEIVQSIAYDPFGKTVYSAGAKEPSYQFTGQEKDVGTGIYYYNARYYDAELGRFLQPDTILSSLNRFSYCGNNPINYVDPTGHVTEASNYADSSWGAHMAPGDTVTYNASGADANHSWSYSSTVTVGSGGYTMQSTGTITTYGEPGDPTHTSTVTNTRDYLSDSTNVASEPPSDVPEQDNKPKDDFSFLDAWNFHVGNFNIAFNRAVNQITNADFGVDFLRQKEGYRQKGDYFNYFLCDVNCILEGTIDYLAIYGLAEAAGWLVYELPGYFAGKGDAGSAGIDTYANLRKINKGTGLEIHHIIEKRFKDIFGGNPRQMASIGLTPETHQAFTNAWRSAFKYGIDYSQISTQQLWEAAQEIYAGFPELLNAAKITLF